MHKNLLKHKVNYHSEGSGVVFSTVTLCIGMSCVACRNIHNHMNAVVYTIIDYHFGIREVIL